MGIVEKKMETTIMGLYRGYLWGLYRVYYRFQGYWGVGLGLGVLGFRGLDKIPYTKTIPQKEVIILLYNGYHSIPKP